MKLKQYLRDNHLKARWLADKLTTTESVVSGWVRGINIPRRDTMRKIEKLTNSQVKPADWVTETDNSQTELTTQEKNRQITDRAQIYH